MDSCIAILIPLPGESRDPFFSLQDGGRMDPGFRREADLWLRPSGIFTRRRLLNDSPE